MSAPEQTPEQLQAELQRLRARLSQLGAAAPAQPADDSALAEQLRIVTDTARVGLVMVDQLHRYRYANQAYAEIFQLASPEIVGLRIADVLPSVYSSQIQPRLERAFAGEAVRYELTLPPSAAGAGARSYAVAYDRGSYRGQPVVVVVVTEITERRQMELALRDQAQVLEQAQVLVRDRASRITLWTQGAEQLYGYTKAEALGQISHELLRTEFPEPLEQIERTLAQTGRWSGTLSHETRQGEQVIVASQWLLDRDQQGQPRRVIEANTDITEQMRADAARAYAVMRLRVLAEASQAFAAAGADEQIVQSQIVQRIAEAFDGACVLRTLSDDGHWLKTVAMHSHSPAQLSDAEIKLAHDPMPLAAVGAVLRFQNERAVVLPAPDVEQMRAMLPAELWPALEQLNTKDRIAAPLKVRGQLIGILGITRERNEQRPISEHDLALVQELADRAALAIENARLFKQLESERAQLARRVAERTADLSLANAELARAARLKDDFLANMSHELRTPLNAILGRSEALQEELYGPVTPKQVDSLQAIYESGQHLLALINDILDLSKIEAGKLELELELIDVPMLCHISLRMIAQTALLKRIAVTSSFDAQVQTMQADERRLKQLLVNLLTNAVKFTPAGGQVGLEVRGDAERGVVTFTIWDTGIGIAEADLPRLFQPFVQIDSSLSREYSGSGLGLALVMRLAKAHGGGVSVASAPGQGSRFSVTLPWLRDEQPASRAPQSSRIATDTPKLQQALIIEDSISAAEQAARYLRELGARVEIQPHGQGTVERASALQPDVIVLDILLPDQDGWSVLTQLKADPRTQAIPVVIISVVDEPERARELGAAAVLLKPLDRGALLRALRTIGQQPAEPPVQTALVVAQQTQRPRILLTEDNQANIDTVVDYLREKGYELIVARNGYEALERAHEQPPDLVLMDIQMPGMDGLETIRRLRARTSSQRMPIIALTALAMPGDRERCLAAGADGYLAKPVSLRNLLATITAELARAAAERAATSP